MAFKRAYGRTARRFAADRRASAAIEFAIVAPVFLSLFFSIVEAGFYFFINSAVDSANAKAARLIKTGQAQDSFTQQTFFDEVCAVVQTFGDCSTDLAVDVSSYGTSFAALRADAATTNCPGAGTPRYQPGVGGDVVRVRICFLYSSLNPVIGLNLTPAGGGKLQMISTSVFRNEPF